MTCARLTRTAPSSASISRNPDSPDVSSCWSSWSLSLARRRESAPPAWKPSATRRGLSSSGMVSSVMGGLDDLGEHRAGGGGMQEGDAGRPDAGAGRLVDERDALVAQPAERRLDVGDLVGDVVQARPLAREEPADGRVGTERAKQLDVVLADVEQHRLDALLLDGLTVHERHAVGLLVQRDRGVEVLDGEAHVVDAAEHGAAVYADAATVHPASARAASGRIGGTWTSRSSAIPS